MSLAEAIYLQYGVNTQLSCLMREQVIEKSLHPTEIKQQADDKKPCPLLKDNSCLLYEFRPGKCRVFDQQEPVLPITQLRELEALSHEILEIFLEEKTPYSPPQLDLCSVVSGKFVQQIFNLMAKPV
jgi:Fe-S-cluster containining protein